MLAKAASAPPQTWWSDLPDELRLELGRHSQRLRYRIGQTVLRADRLPHQVAIVEQGKLRLLLETTRGASVTLDRLTPGQSIGWVGLIRADPCETVIAMEESVLSVIPAKQFLQVLAAQPKLASHCNQVPISELAHVVVPWLWQRPQQCHQPLALIQKLQASGCVSAITAKEVETHQSVAGIGPLILPSGRQGRFLAIDQSCINTLLSEDLLEADSQTGEFQKGALQDNNTQTELSKIPAESIAVAGALPPPIDPHELGLTLIEPVQRQLDERASGAQGTALACLKRLAQTMGFPLPRDTMTEVLTDCEQRLGGITLLHLGQLLEGLGMDVRPLRCRPQQLHRVEAPALLRRGETFLLLEATGAKSCRFADPTAGLIELNLDALERQFPDGIEMVLVRRGIDTEADLTAAQFNLTWFLQTLEPYRNQVVLVLLSGAIGKLLELVFPLAVFQIIDAVVGGGNASILTPIGIVMGVAIVAMALLGWLRQLLLTDLGDRIDTRLGSQIVSHLFRLPVRFFDRRTVGDLSSRLYDLQRVRQFITETATNSLLDLLFMPIVAICLFAIQPVLSLIVLLEVPLLLAINLVSGPIAKRMLARRNIAWGKSQGFMVEVVSAIKTVKSQNFITQARWQWLQRYQRYTGEDYRLSRNRALVKEISGSVEKTMRVVLFMVAAWMALNGWASIGALFAIFILSAGVTGPLLNLSRVWDQYRDAQAAMDAVADVLGQQPEESLSTANQLPLPSIRGELELENVTFSYGLGSGNQLDKFNLKVPAGHFLGLVGLSGSGKSTVVQLLDGLYRSDEGRVFIDGIDIAKVQISSLRRQIGFVPQESILFDGTVLDNIRLNFPDAPYEAIVDACQVACAHEFIMSLSDGYNSRVGERGGGLSGGQKQRLAIARMVLQNPRMVILDEATSALDPDTEKRVITNLRERFKDRTFLFVTHRLGNLRKADRILVMDQGKLSEEGSWEELIEARGIFSTLALQQHETPESA